jgi:hypothetical protein
MPGEFNRNNKLIRKPNKKVLYQAESIKEKMGSTYNFLCDDNLETFAKHIKKYDKPFEISYKKPFDLKFIIKENETITMKIENLSSSEKNTLESYLKL